MPKCLNPTCLKQVTGAAYCDDHKYVPDTTTNNQFPYDPPTGGGGGLGGSYDPPTNAGGGWGEEPGSDPPTGGEGSGRF